MLPRKIISSGKDGADQAALDVAIKLGMACGGWMPDDQNAANDKPEKKYSLKKTTSGTLPNHIEKNVIDSDGTLILSHGKLADPSIWQDRFAERHYKPWLHIDLNRMTLFEASIQISQWVLENHIEILNVTGAKAGSDQKICDDTRNVLESAIFLGQTYGDKPVDLAAPLSEEKQPQTVAEAVKMLLSGLSLKDRVLIANMTAAELESLDQTLGNYIRNTFGIRAGNDALVASCRFESRNQQLHEDEVSALIINRLWEELRKTHKLKRIK